MHRPVERIGTLFVFFSSRRRHTRFDCDWSSDVCSSDLIRAINIEKGDELIDVQVTDGRNDIVLATRQGMSIRFQEKDVRDMGRTATGVKGIELDKKDHVIDMVVVRRKSTLLTVTEKGMGKRPEPDENPGHNRGARGTT